MRAGMRIGEVELVEPLGRGGMGLVWLAHHPRLDAPVAIKMVSVEGRDGQNLERLRREARLAARLSCPHVVRVFDVGEHEGEPYLVMERLEGESLAERLERERSLAPADVAVVVKQIGAALAAAHGAGIVHRDVKPGNIFLVSGPLFAKLLDFGVARGPDPASALTQTGAVVGTVHYMSPEQLASRPFDHRADLWALAVVAYRALTGRLPFEGQSISEVAMAVERGVFPPPSSHVSGLGGDVDAWFKRALCRSLALRFTSAAELSESLEQALGRRSVVGSAESEPSPEEDTLAAPPEGERALFVRDESKGRSLDSDETTLSASRVPVARRKTSRLSLGLVALLAAAGLSLALREAFSEAPNRLVPSGLPRAEVDLPVPQERVVERDPEPSIPLPVVSATTPPSGKATPPPPRAEVDCRQPFRVDENGDYHPRPECLR